MFASAVLDAPVAEIWAVLRDFNSHARWHPLVADSEIEHFHAPDTVGCVRRFTLRDGARLREQLLFLSDREHALRYCILSSTIPLFDYVAELRVRPVGAEWRAFVTWQGRFRAPPGREHELRDLVAREVYQAGLTGLNQFFRAGARPAVPAP